jgi:hypothetical protein
MNSSVHVVREKPSHETLATPLRPTQIGAGCAVELAPASGSAVNARRPPASISTMRS